MLVLPIKKKWYDMILSGEKKEEYRSYSPYWLKRFCNAGMMELIHGAEGDYYKAKRYTHRLVKLRNGYSANSRSFVADVSLEVGLGNPKWGAKEGERYLVLRIAKIMDEGQAEEMTEREQLFYSKGYSEGRKALLEEITNEIYEIDDCLYDDDYANGFNAAINKVIDAVNKVAGGSDGRE